ncbi:MAG: VWA domain-containing protein [Deltaproteobacteria bacterium]|nr:VWA domain-containing protein [Deltaproteobacteria bacterium]
MPRSAFGPRPRVLRPFAGLATWLALGALVAGAGGCKKADYGGGYSAKMGHAEYAASMDEYAPIQENQFLAVEQAAVSTFAVDVDTASYSNVRRFLSEGSLPPADAVRVEELINYFDYDYPAPGGDTPFSVSTEIADCPWNEGARLLHIGLQGQEIAAEQLPARNLVFLLDVSGSMEEPDKLPLLRRAMKLVVSTLDADDRVAIVVYAGASGVVLPPTSGADQQAIMAALDRLEAGGSTNGGAGIQQAYALARESFDPGAINRVILATDGDFNVGTVDLDDLQRLIERERESGVFLSVLGFGRGNLGDSTMELLADKGNGNYAYIDSISEARKVLIEEAGATLVTIAKDVKVQVEFDPARVESYRLIGYENRLLDARDFADDRKDAGEIGAGHSVTALYEIVPKAAEGEGPVAELRLRYKQPAGEQSQLLTFAIVDAGGELEGSSDDFRFAAAVAEFGMLLRGSDNAGGASWSQVVQLAAGAVGEDRGGHRREFMELVERAGALE